MDIEKIVAEMPKAKNSFSPDESLWDRATVAQCQLLAEQGWIKAFPRSDSELISRERQEQAISLQDCGGQTYSKGEREDLIRTIREGAEIQRDYMVMQGWRKVPSEARIEEQLYGRFSIIKDGITRLCGAQDELAYELHRWLLEESNT